MGHSDSNTIKDRMTTCLVWPTATVMPDWQQEYSIYLRGIDMRRCAGLEVSRLSDCR
jgi:hypothetical protein